MTGYQSTRADGKDRGATLIEAALVFPMMIAILIGTLELGLAFKEYLTVSYATREGSRVGALAGDDTDADCHIVHAVVDIIGDGSTMDKLQQLEIFAADPATGNPILSKVNTWTYVGTDPYNCASDWTIVENWPSTSRNVEFGPTKELDIIGVQIQYDHDWITGMPPFSGTLDIDETTITRLEPEAFE